MRFSRPVPCPVGVDGNHVLSVILEAPAREFAFDFRVAHPDGGSAALVGRYVLRPSGSLTTAHGSHCFQFVSSGVLTGFRESVEEALALLPRFRSGDSVQPFVRLVIDAHVELLREAVPAMSAFCAAILLGTPGAYGHLEDARKFLDVMEVQGS